jgi:hypothetical protein
VTEAFGSRELPAGLEMVADVAGVGGAVARIGIRRARSGDLVEAYPAGTHDREILIEGSPAPTAVAELTMQLLAADPRCRRVVLPVPESDLDTIAWAEDAGFRFVVNVETRNGEYALLVTEPDWVLAQPHILEDIPLKE